MFENLIGQDRIASDLRRETARNKLPPAALFHGEEYTGKLTCALELARGLNCEKEDAPWGCNCSSCRKHRLLMHPKTLISGSRYFQEEIEACTEAYRRSRSVGSLYLFVRAVRKLIRRFDPILIDDAKGAIATIEDLEEKLRAIDPARPPLEDSKLERQVKGILKLSKKLASEMGGGKISVAQIRRISGWVHETSDDRKVVILEGVDGVNTSVWNALLKLLEEPPGGVTFLLLAIRRSSIPPTILSRVREYPFQPRDEDASRIILEKIFKVENLHFRSLREYFLGWNTNLEAIKKVANRFMDDAMKGSPLDRTPLVELFSAGRDNGRTAILFFQELLHLLERRFPMQKLMDDPLTARLISKWCSACGSAATGVELYHRSPLLLAEELHHRMRAKT